MQFSRRLSPQTFVLIQVWVGAIIISSPLLVFRQQGSRRWANHDEIWCDDEWPIVWTRDNATGLVTSSFPLRYVFFSGHWLI